ncbi:CYtochrome P450 family [Caenorhabditis elegans]|uniref:CYtochrome P450 family n=1 Tax=Caenorhabditis elegans TaxID=6239 RepID=O44650_CAEEL|nr:CYtochrome P450 family [Caenorhabditis elegans]CCD72733.2 CYtochrome P450 family [Caenorhabditis elegans]|eukprot:NP_001309511.1 CYtochrome P450 family [Caenorhabditis elegans]
MIFVLLLTTFLAVLIIRQYQKARKLPPGPVSLPLIGNIHQLVYHIWNEKGVVPAFDLFRKKYGDVFTIWLGPIPHVSICNYETSQEVFVKNGNKYKDRFLPPVYLHVSNNLGLFTANGPVCAEMRKFTLLAFRNMGVGRDLMEQRILDELNTRCAEIDADAVNGKTIVHTTEFFDLTVGSVINSLLVGKRFEAEDKDDFLEIKRLMAEAADLFTMFDLVVPVWFLKSFFPSRFERVVAIFEKALNYLSREALARYEKLKTGEYSVNAEDPQDFVEAYLAKMEQERLRDSDTPYTMECLKFVIGDLWLAGQDTTSTTLVAGFNHLVKNPEIVRKCREEILRITENGSRPLQLKDRAESHYLNATIAEIQRHASILNVNFWRLVHEPTTVQGHPVDSGSVICAQLGALHVNDDLFKNPDKFYPERFIENEQLLSQIIPFGIGKRSCVGENIAKSELYLMIGNLILRYDIKPHGSEPSTEDKLPYSAGKTPDKSVKLEFVKL